MRAAAPTDVPQPMVLPVSTGASAGPADHNRALPAEFTDPYWGLKLCLASFAWATIAVASPAALIGGIVGSVSGGNQTVRHASLALAFVGGCMTAGVCMVGYRISRIIHAPANYHGWTDIREDDTPARPAQTVELPAVTVDTPFSIGRSSRSVVLVINPGQAEA